ncbi:hypothetical protein FRB99_005138 [Tulasnella sp. 403]|nr:hypothetical protein FRB99_005138 [Tulasnella sp. 403]
MARKRKPTAPSASARPRSDSDEEQQVAGELEDQDSYETQTITAEQAKYRLKDFRSMERFRSADFKKGDDVLVRPEGVQSASDEHRLWKARIDEVRKSRGQVHVAVRWYYSIADLRMMNVPPGCRFQPRDSMGSFEVIYSTHYDVISSGAIVNKAEIARLGDAPDQVPISPDTWYTRATYDLSKQRFTVSPSACAVCREFYNPDLEDDMQSYCPQCRCWYHQRCLDVLDRQSLKSHALEAALEANVPDSGRNPKSKKRKVDSRTNGSPNGKRKAAEMKLLTTLHRIAGSQIVRGGQEGVAGDVKAICTARKILQDLEDRVRKWDEVALDQELGSDVIEASDGWPTDLASCFSCPQCSSAI